jgi:hypothetical protein
MWPPGLRERWRHLQGLDADTINHKEQQLLAYAEQRLHNDGHQLFYFIS